MCTEHHLGSGTLKPQATFCACKRHKNQAPGSLSPLAVSLLVILSSPEAFSSTPRLTTHKLIFHVSAELVLLLKISMRVFNQQHKLIYQALYPRLETRSCHVSPSSLSCPQLPAVQAKNTDFIFDF